MAAQEAPSRPSSPSGTKQGPPLFLKDPRSQLWAEHRSPRGGQGKKEAGCGLPDSLTQGGLSCFSLSLRLPRHLQQSQGIRWGSRWSRSPQLTVAPARCCTGSLHTPLPLGSNGARAAGGGAPGSRAPAGKQLLFWMTSA